MTKIPHVFKSNIDFSQKIDNSRIDTILEREISFQQNKI